MTWAAWQSDAKARGEINPLLRKLGVWVGLSFGSAVKGKKRVVRRLQGGMITFGGQGLPVPMYGTRNRQPGNASGSPEQAGAGADANASTPGPCNHEQIATHLGQQEAISFTKGYRGDRI